MKNLKHKKDLSYFPQREKIRNPDGWGSGHGTWHNVDGVSPWKRVKNICNAYIGKPFDRAFSAYCKQVPVYQQHYFLEEFDNKRWWWAAKYFVDQQGNIQKTKKPKTDKSVIFKSDNFKEEYRHKETGELYQGWYGPGDKEYEYVIVSGYALKFSSKKDPEFIRLTSDQLKRRKARKRKRDKEKIAKENAILAKAAKERKEKEKKENKGKIERKGFDNKISFRNDKGK